MSYKNNKYGEWDLKNADTIARQKINRIRNYEIYISQQEEEKRKLDAEYGYATCKRCLAIYSNSVKIINDNIKIAKNKMYGDMVDPIYRRKGNNQSENKNHKI